MVGLARAVTCCCGSGERWGEAVGRPKRWWEASIDRELNRNPPPALGPLSLCTFAVISQKPLLSGVNAVILLPVSWLP